MATHTRHAVNVFKDEVNDEVRKGERLYKNPGKTARQVLRNVSNVPRHVPQKKEENIQSKKDKENKVAGHSEKSCIGHSIAPVKDIDEGDAENLTLCAEYVNDIYRYLRKNEQRLIPSNYLPSQMDITEKMRTILVDWLIQVHSKFTLLQETLYLTVYLIDRYLDKEQVNKSELQLVGVTAMLLASKYEEMYAPEISDFVYITDTAYSKLKIIKMEQKMMKVLGYDFSHPLCLQFLRRNSKAGEVDALKHTLAKYLMELSLICYELSQCRPSKIAAAALFLSIKLIDSSEWTPTLQHYSGYCEKEILSVVGILASAALSIEGSKYEAIKGKYSASRLLKVSTKQELKGEVIKYYAAYATTGDS